MKNSQDLGISFEIFPPKTAEGFHHLTAVCQEFIPLNPKYISVTFGAGGSAQEKTQAMIQYLVAQRIPTTPHISCVDMTWERLNTLLNQYISFGIHRLVVIQGDISTDNHLLNRDFQYAVDLITAIRKLTGEHFHIAVAAYPEFHPRAKDPQADLENFQQKVAAGANSAITQFFYNADAYARFLEYCDQLNIHIPIIPGIMPIDNYQKLSRFATACDAEIPLWLRKRLTPYLDDPGSTRILGIEIVTKLCERLIKEGAPSLHFYTLNQVAPTIEIVQNLAESVAISL